MSTNPNKFLFPVPSNMLLDGTIVEDQSRRMVINDTIHDVFGFDTPKEKGIFSGSCGGKAKLSDIPALLLHHLQTGFPQAENQFENGRIGPKKVKWNSKPASTFPFRSHKNIPLTIESISSFSSLRGNVCVFEGKWMYEITLHTNGVQQLGWATLSCPFTGEIGVGDASDSYSYDGKRQKKWNKSHGDYGESWERGDIIGTCIDLETNHMTFYRNGKSMGVAFDNVRSHEEGMAYFPAVSLSIGEKSTLNFGETPFHYPVEGFAALESGAQQNVKRAEYLVSCIRKLVPLLNEDKRNSSKCQKMHEMEEKKVLDSADILILFAALFDFYAPMLADSRVYVIPLVDFFLTLDVMSLNNVCEMISLCFYDNKESSAFQAHLLMEIAFRAATTSWLPPQKGSTKYIELALHLIKIPFVSQFLHSDACFFNEWMIFLLDTKLPSFSDLKILFPKLEEAPRSSEDDEENISLCEPELFATLSVDLEENHVIQKNMFQYLLQIPAGEILHGRIKSFLSFLIQKNAKANTGRRPTGLSSPSLLLNIFLNILEYLAPFLKSIEQQQVSYLFSHLFYDPDWNSDATRFGGTFSHLKKNSPVSQEDVSCLEDEKSAEMEENWKLLECCMHLSSYGLFKTLRKATNRLSAYKESNKQIRSKEKPNESPSGLLQIMKDKRNSQALLMFWDKLFWIRPCYLSLYWKMNGKICNYLQDVQKSNVFLPFVPEYYLEFISEMIYFVSGSMEPSFAFSKEENAFDTSHCISFLLANINNPQIINPDMKDKIIVLITQLCYDACMPLLEQSKHAPLFIPSLLEIFSMGHHWFFTIDLLLVLWKGEQFGRRKKSLLASVHFQKEFVKFCEIEEEKVNLFLNHLFNNLNSVLTNFRVAIKDLKESRFLENETLRRKSVVMFELCCKLLQFIENISISYPSLFYSTTLNMIRFSELVLGVLSTVGNENEKFLYFLKKLRSSTESTESYVYSIYGPVCGIFTNLFDEEMRRNAIEDSVELSLSAALIRVDAASDGKQYESLLQFSWEQVKTVTPEALEKDMPRLNIFIDALTADYRASSLDAEEIDDDDDSLCPICYSQHIDTTFIPCGHHSCKQCITRQLLDHPKCFFCNAAIEDTKPLEINPIKEENIELENEAEGPLDSLS